MWANADRIIRFADHEWTERTSQPNGTRVTMNWTLSNAASAVARHHLVRHELDDGVELEALVEGLPELVERAHHSRSLGDVHVVPGDVHLVGLQRPRRGPGDVLPLQVVLAVVAGAPDVLEVGAVLHLSLIHISEP